MRSPKTESIRHRWLEALESGKYKQGYSKLRSKQLEFCCLGVLCDIIAPDGWETSESHCHSFGPLGYYLHYEDSPEEVRELFGTDKETFDHNMLRFGHLNDGEHFSFTQIAEVIRHFF